MSRAALAAACLILVSGSTFSTEVLEDTIEKTIPLSPTGKFSVNAIDGSVEIYGAERDEVKIVATRKAFSPERLNKIKIQVSAQSDSVSINTSAPGKPHWGLGDRSGTVDYTINLPQRAQITFIGLPNGELIIHGMRGVGITASLGNGRLIAHNCFCDQRLRVQSGSLDLFFDWDEQRPITIDGAIVSGNARAIIAADASFQLHAASTHGRVASDFTEMPQRKRGGVSEINEVIGPAPFSKLTLHATDGNIQISEMIW